VLQVVQNIRTGATTVEKLPVPLAPDGGLLVATAASLVSAGTERYVVELAKKGLLAKARERPDHVRRVLQKLRQEGLVAVATQVRAKLDEPMPLGYSSAGIVLECGRGVQEYKPGDRVATAGPHAEVVSIGKNLCARVPDDVSLEHASYAAVGAIALEGVRLARVSLGERVLVIGLGLIGQMAVALLKAQGCLVFGTDVDPKKLELARAFGADVVMPGAPREAVMGFSDSHGVDAVVITAATESNEPIEFAADVARQRGRIVLVGVVGLKVPRAPFFAKELEFTVSCSLGPGRTDPMYEERGIDYPIGFARWTAQRNMRAVLEIIAAGKLPVDKLTTHRYPIERAPDAYALITARKEPHLGIVLKYPETHERPQRKLTLSARPSGQTSLGVGVIGAGNFVRLVLMPQLARTPHVALRGLCTAKGMNAVTTGDKYGFAYAATDVEEVLHDRETSAVVIGTRHDLHADLVVRALRAGKHVFVEKPLCIRAEELDSIERCVRELGKSSPLLMVGFNRRFAPATAKLRGHFAGVQPLSVSYRFASGAIPKDAWPQDEDVGGGRIVGEACHAIDTCAAIVGSPPVRVFAESVAQGGGLQTTDDRVFISMRHANGSISCVSYQAGGDRAGPVERLEVFGGGRTATVEEWDHIELWRDNQVERMRGKDKGHAGELVAFVEACRRGGEWPIPWEHLYGVTWASLMAVLSLREGLPMARDGA
jgi:predicted dehydrogenase